MSAPPTRKWALLLVLLSAVVGVIDGILLTWDHLQFVLQTDDGVCSGGADSACSITHSADVSINRIPLPGGLPPLPLAVLAVGCYLVVAWMAIKVLSHKSGSKRALSHLLLIGIASVLLSVSLAVYSLVYQGSICPYCAILYGASAMLLVGAICYSRRSLKERFIEALGSLKSKDTAIHIGLFLLSVTITYGIYARAIKPPPPAISQTVVTIDTKDRPMLGDPAAPVHFAEFIDYGCGHCRDLSETLHDLLESRPGKVKVSILNFPLANCDERRGSCFIPRASECLFKQGAFPAFSKEAFELGSLSLEEQKEKLPSVVEALGVNVEDFNQCMEDKETMEKIKKDRRHGRDLGVTGTPALFANGRRVSGAKPLDELEKLVDNLAEGSGR